MSVQDQINNRLFRLPMIAVVVSLREHFNKSGLKSNPRMPKGFCVNQSLNDTDNDSYNWF